METRKITVVASSTNSKYVIETDATTLGELKAAFRSNNIPYQDDMTFFEGLTKTEFKDDSSILPTNVPYKGTTTNELVFMITNTNKKIKSGAMDRTVAYAAIKSNNLQDKCVEMYGKNFTQCKTAELEQLIIDNTAKEEAKVNKEETTVVGNDLKEAFNLLVNYLYDEDYISTPVFQDIQDCLADNKKEKISSPYTNSDIDEMFAFTRN